MIAPELTHLDESKALSGKVSQNCTYPMFVRPQFLAVRKLFRPEFPLRASCSPATLAFPTVVPPKGLDGFVLVGLDVVTVLLNVVVESVVEADVELVVELLVKLPKMLLKSGIGMRPVDSTVNAPMITTSAMAITMFRCFI